MSLPDLAKWVANNPDKVKAARAKYLVANKDKIRAQRLIYIAANKERLKAHQKAYDATRNRQEIRHKYVRTYRLRKYGLSEMAYNLMLCLQRFACAICKKPFENKRIHVDHCHDSGEVRGLLCFKCNAGIGLFDRPDDLSEAKQYLQ